MKNSSSLQKRFLDDVGRSSADFDASPTETVESLSRVDEVIVKDSWNKFLAFDEMLIEMFFERLILDVPELVDQFGLALDQAPTELLALIDRAVRGLDARTETTLREAYRAAPGAAGARGRTAADSAAFFSTYGVTAEHWAAVGRTFLWTIGKVPYLEDFERDNLGRGPDSAAARFFALHVARPMIAAAEAEDRALAADVVAEMQAGAEAMLAHPQDAGIFFYQTLFRTHPEVLRHFRTADMDMLSRHLIETVVFLSRAATRPKSLRQELRNLAQIHQSNAIPTADYPKLAGPLLETLGAFGATLTPRTRLGWETLFGRVIRIISEPMAQQERLVAAAREFLDQAAEELGWPPARLEKRWAEIVHEIRATGSYTQTFEELEHGARLAWRNAPKCIGRISWKNLIVRDRRHVVDPDEMFAECVEHLRAATNGGNIEIVLTMFRPTRPGERWGPRIWNSQLIRYAGYRLADGSVVGDRANIELTAAIRRLGWEPPADPTDFDLLPLVIDMPGHEPRLHHLDPADVLEVPITHPSAPAIGALGLKWCAVPAIANFRLDIGGINYGCLPFNGWFMGTEIARNLWEEKRYDRAEAIAQALGLDMSSEATLWRDRAFLELNVAIVHSFQQARVTLVDHQTASRQFMIHDLREKKAGRECPAQWSWIAPAAGGSTTPVWHHEMRDFHLRPCYAYAADRWAVTDHEIGGAREGVAAEDRARRPLILYASETGTAEGYARQAGRRLAGLAPQVLSMDEADVDQIARESLVLVIAATCRDGDAPGAGQAFLDWLRSRKPAALKGVGFAVLGIGNRIYPKFCAAAAAFDAAFEAAGAERAAALELADEIAGQSDTVKQWLEMFAKMLAADGQAAKARRAVVEIIPPARAPARAAGAYARVAFNEEMLGPGAGPGRSTRHIGFDLAAEAGGYATGDHLAVHPVNPDALVDGVCGHLGLPREAWFRILGASNPALDRYRDGYPVGRLLAEDLDLGMPEAPEELLAAMRVASRDPDDLLQLDRWLATLDLAEADPARRSLRERLRETYHSLLDLFDAFPQSVPPVDVLIELLPRQKPRLYSIASSPRAHPRQVRIMAGALTTPSADGRPRRGLCSHYLRRLEPGALARIAVKPAPRRLPEDFAGPLVMIGAGTGLAPLCGALEDRAARGARATDEAPVALYAGFRSEAEFLRRAEITAWRAEGYLSRIGVAFSRKGPAKAYVQDALDGDGALVRELLERPEAHLVICGDAKMAQDVEERLLQILQREGGLGYPAALARLQAMKREGRYIEDVWGVQLNREVALPELVRAKYDRGAGWLARITRALSGRRPEAGSIERW
jgi:nitric oxide synthase oxygenase domain/subunit/sulfite reductase alpha subunit-like flavoprotein/hemoglobin-like flavoprotein